MVTVPLHHMREGEEGIVCGNPCDSEQGTRLAELGLTEGESIHILRHGSPMLLQIGATRLCLRNDSAAQVAVLCAR